MELTEKAILKIKEFSDNEGIGHYTIRLKLVGGGCAGFIRDMEYDNNILDSDEAQEFGDIKVIIDPISFMYLEDVIIDYVDNLMGGGFKFSGDGAKGSCGCGSSISY
jgi:iron-sulfur cluster insertion protein